MFDSMTHYDANAFTRRILHLFVIFLGLFFSKFCYSNSSQATDVVQEFPSAWAWKIVASDRVVYLIGEFHSFEGTRSFTINHRLGIDLYDVSSKVWTEVLQNPPNSLRSIKLFQHITIETQMALESGIRSAVGDIVGKNDQNRISENFLKKLENSDPFDAYSNINAIATVRNRKNNKNLVGYNGLHVVLNEINNENKLKKIFDIEENTVLAEMWWKYCDSDQVAEALVNSAVKSLDSNRNLIQNSNEALQKIFFSPDGNEELFHDAFLAQSEGFVFNKCIVNPRTLIWLPKIIKALKTNGPPVAFLVGLAHIGGKDGLLELIRNSGFSNIKRIYSINDK